MKDIDFDELDKAVNSLMSRAQKDKTTSTNTSTPAVPQTPPVNEPDMPLTAAPATPGVVKPKSAAAVNPDAQPAVTPEPKNTIVPRSMAAPAARRSGRFMDVVPAKPAPAARPASREGVSITPLTGDAKAETAPVVSEPAATSQPAPLPMAEHSAPKNEWPDPIEIATAKTPPVGAQADATSESSPAVEPTTETEKSKEQPLSSPFLPDAKVEKRPLGSPASSVPMIAPESELAVPVPDDSDAQLPVKPTDLTSEAPEEFGGDIMQVEADTHMGVPKTDEIHPVDEKNDTAQQSQESEKRSTSSDDEMPSSEPSASGRISIPPQYKEQPSTGEKESGAIYDTSTYHQPLMHPTKKKSGWLWVLWIVLILIVGAGAGAALYFLGIM